MYANKLLSIGLVALLLLSMTVIMVPVSADAHDANAMWVDPGSTTGLKQDDLFTVDVMVNLTTFSPGATGLYGFEYKLKWNGTIVELMSRTVHNPWAAYYPNYTIVKDLVGTWADGRKYHWLSISALYDAPAFTGVTSFCTYTFKVKYQAYFPEPDFTGTLDIQDDKLADDKVKPIVHDTFDGTYTIPTIMPLPPSLSVIDPVDLDNKIWKPANESYFNVTIVMNNLAPAWDFYGWEAKLLYNGTLINATNIVEGPFLPGFAGPNGTYLMWKIYNSLGYVHIAGFFLNNHLPASGTGVLAIITFRAIYQTIFPPELQTGCDLALFQTKMANSTAQPIPHTSSDGWYEAPHKVLGRFIDVFTGNYRFWGQYTPYVGRGKAENADAFAPQDNVTLYAEVLYNDEPEQNKMVAFEIYGPPNPIYNVTIFRTAITNASGIATTWFTIPWPCTDAEEQIFGKWLVYASVEIKTVKVDDTLHFAVGWLVELLTVTASATVQKCDLVNVSVTFKNIMMIPKDVVLTVTILDELDDPIAWFIASFRAPAGEYCHPKEGKVNGISMHIPKWAHVGMATVYVNAFTDLPTNCGSPYCPEISVDFVILKTT